MKRLLIALVAAVAVSTGFARVTDKQSFESSFDDFKPSVADEDDSALAAYNNDAPTYVTPPYNFANNEYGQRYLSLDTGAATLWRTNADEAAYFDMVMQFNPSATAPEIDEDTKIAVYVGSDEQGNPQLFVLSGDGDGNVVTNMAGVSYNTSNWIRLTIASNNGMFYLYANGVAEPCGPYYPLPGKDATIKSVGFKGTGKLDDFVARTTDPFTHPETYVAKVGGDDGEYYETFAAALADGQTTLSAFNYTFSTQNGGDYDAETNPYVIATVEDLLALMYGGNKAASYVQTANIDMAGVAPYLGINNFSGVYDGGNFAISNVTLAVAEYTGIFRTVTGTVKNLTVSNMGFGSNATDSFGCAIVGKADGNAVIQNLKAEGTFCGADDAGARHNTAAIVVIVETAANGGTVQILDCVNNATVYGRHHRVGGILAYTRNEGNVVISNCVNNGELVWNSKSDPENPRGIAGIVACPEGTGTVTIMDCVNTGSFTVNGAAAQANVDAATGDIVGYFYGKSSSGTFVENGGNTYRAAGKLAGAIAGTVTVTKCPYAIASTVDAVDYLTTVKADGLAAGNTYTLLNSIDAGTVFTLTTAGDYISFNTNGFNFAGTVAAGTGLGVAAKVSDATITYSAGIAAVDNVAYSTFAAAVAALDGATDDYVTLLANVPAYMLASGKTLKVMKNGFNISVSVGDTDVYSYRNDGDFTTYSSIPRVAYITKNDATTNYATLQAAFDAAVADDTVYLDADSTEDVTVNAGKSFTLVENENATFSGTFDGAGTVAMTAKPKAVSADRFASTWTGTFQVCWNPDSSNARINFNDLGNANSKVEIVGVNGAFIALPSTNWGTSDGGTPTIQPELVITASWVINNGWSTMTTINKLSGTGELVVNGSSQGDTPVPYTVNTIDGFSGTLKGTRSQYTLGNIVYANSTFGDCLVKIGSVFAPALGSTTLNGSAADLCFDTLNAQKGVYMVAAAATVEGVTTQYASVANAIAAVGTPTGNTSVPTVAVYDSSSAEYPGWTLDGTTYTYGGTRAKIGTAEYKTLTLALAAAGTETATEIELVGACSETVTIPANVTVAVDNGIAFSGTVAGAGTIVYTATPSGTLAFGDWTGTVNLNYANIVSTADFAAVANARGIAGSWVEIGENGTASGYMNSNLNPSLKVTGFMEFKNGSTTRQPSIPALTGDGVVVFTYFYNNGGETTKYAVSNLVDWDGIITNESSVVVINSIDSGAGTVLYKKKPATAPTIGSGWEGTFVADWEGAKGDRIDINAYGNENSVVEVTRLAGGYASAGSANFTVVPTVNVSGTMRLDNGFGDYVTTFTRLTGSGTVTFHYYYVDVTTLDNFTGTFTTSGGISSRIGTINLSSTPAAGDKVLTLGEGTSIELLGNTKLSVNGVVQQDIELEQLNDGPEGRGVYVKDNTVYVAQIGDDKFETLAAAVAAAQAGDTITLLGNLALDARVEPNKTMTFDLGGYTLSRTGTGGNGSVIDVRGGNVTITNGVIDCTQDDTAIVADGVYALTVRSGATLTLDALTVTVDSQAGACVYPFAGATVTILGGTYGNETAVAYQYHANWTGMAVNQANVASQLITIYGGRFYKVDPSLGDDSELVDTFLAEGYESKKDGDYWVVSEKSGINPSDTTPKADVEAKDGDEAIEKVEVVPPADAGITTPEDLADYKDLFNYSATEKSTGVYEVTLTSIKEEKVAKVNEDAVESLVAAAQSEATTVSVDVPAGLYYKVTTYDTLGGTAVDSETGLSDGNGTTAVDKPASTTQGFIKVEMSTVPFN